MHALQFVVLCLPQERPELPVIICLNAAQNVGKTLLDIVGVIECTKVFLNRFAIYFILFFFKGEEADTDSASANNSPYFWILMGNEEWRIKGFNYQICCDIRFLTLSSFSLQTLPAVSISGLIILT